MKKLVLIFVTVLGINSTFISCQNQKERYESQGFKFCYNRCAFTELNPVDFSWKFLEEFDQQGYFVLNVKRKTLVINNDEGDELFRITRLEKYENGYIASTNKDNILIISPDYNRISLGRENSNKFMMFILFDKDTTKLGSELKTLSYQMNH